MLACAAALNWTAPVRRRQGRRGPIHPIVSQSWAARTALNGGDGGLALQKLLPLLRAMPVWPGGWQMAVEAYTLVGEPDRAAECAQRIRLVDRPTISAQTKAES